MAAISAAQALMYKRVQFPGARKLMTSVPGMYKFLESVDATSGAISGFSAAGLGGTDETAFVVGASGGTTPRISIAENTGKTGDYTLTIKPGTLAASRDVLFPDSLGASDTIVTLAATQTLTGKTLNTPTIADFTNANHDHSTTAKGGAISTNVTGTTNSTFSVNLGAATPQLDITAAGSTGDFTMTLQVPTIAAARTVTLPAVTCTLASIAGTETLTNKTLTAPALTLPTITDGLHASGSVSNDFSTSTGTFKTSTGAVTIGSGAIGLTGDVTVATNKNVVFTAGTG